MVIRLTGGGRIVGDPGTEGFDHVDVGGQRDGPARTARVRVDRSVPRHARQVREGGQGKALDWRESRNGGPTEMEECPTLPADHMRVWQ